MNESVVLACESLVKEFRQGPAIVRVLRGVNASIRRGERLAVVGASGSGKTTLLQLLGGLDLPTSGRVLIDGREMSALPDAERGRLRNVAMGFVYQFHHLLPEFSALENVAMPLLIRRMPRAEANEKARALLARVGLADRLTHRPSELSGGERLLCAEGGPRKSEQQPRKDRQISPGEDPRSGNQRQAGRRRKHRQELNGGAACAERRHEPGHRGSSVRGQRRSWNGPARGVPPSGAVFEQ